MSSDISQLLQTGLEHHQSGRLQEADRIYRSIIEEHPQHPDAWHLLGVLAHQAGNSELAVNCIENAIKINPDEPDFYNNCGEACRALGKFEKAIALFKQALAIKPDFAGAHNNLGNALKEWGKLDEAITHYEQAINSNPDFFMARNNLGLALKERGQLDEAVTHYKKALATMPDYAEAHSNLGNVLQALGRYEEAITHYEQAITIMPEYAEAHSNLGNALRELERPEDAIGHYEKALTIKPDFAMAHYNLGITLDELRRTEQAITHYERAIAIKPDYAEAHNNLSFTLQELGRRDEAIEHYKRALAIKPDYAAAHLHLSMIIPEQEQAVDIEKLLLGSSVSATDASHYHFALGNIYANDLIFDQAFEHYSRANEFKRRSISYDSQDYTSYVDKLIETCTKTGFERSAAGSDSELPLFIVGLPRSGTSLVEQILSSHPQVHGAGELVLMQNIEKSLAKEIGTAHPYQGRMPLCNDDVVDKYALEYLQALRTHDQHAVRITDKDPGNFNRIGLIKTLFPKARIIHCQRNALDTCTSIFFNYFSEGNTYSFKLDELGRYYLDYQRLMAHWSSLFPEDILTIQYEDLVTEQENFSRQLLKHSGLEWDAACLDFHLNKRAVRTASSVQVRQPMYKRSINRWKHYEKQLAPLIQILQHTTSATPT